MSLKKAHGIILWSRKQGETSKILSLYTREFGKLHVMAKGSRGIKSKYLGSLETYYFISIVFYHKENRSMHYLSDVSLEEAFPHLHQRLGKLALASVPCEIIEKSEIDEHAHPQLFQHVLDTLYALEKAEKGLKNIIRSFMIKFSSLAGFEPDFSQCMFCHKQEIHNVAHFSLKHGAYACADCAHELEAVHLLSAEALRLMRWLSQVPISRACEAKVSKTAGEQAEQLLVNYMRYHIESINNLKSLEYVKQLESALLNSTKSQSD